MKNKLYSLNQLQVGDKFEYCGKIYTKVWLDFHLLKDGTLLVHSNIPDGLVMNEYGSIGVWSTNPEKLNDICLTKIN